MKSVILTAGKGTCLRPLTENKPKTLVETDNKPLIDYTFNSLISVASTDFVVVVGYKAEQIINRYDGE